MMNNGQHSMPMYPGRRHDMPYNQPPPQGPYAQPYHGYPPQQMPQHYQHAPAYIPQWPQYAMQPQMQPQMPRPYPYGPMMNAGYPMPPNPPPSISPRPQMYHPPPPASMRPQPMVPAPIPQPHQSPSPAARPSPPPAPPPAPTSYVAFSPALPWYSAPEKAFPKRSKGRKRTFAPQTPGIPVEFPNRDEQLDVDSNVPKQSSEKRDEESDKVGTEQSSTPVTSAAPSEAESTQPTTPSSAVPSRTTTAGPPAATANKPANKLLPIVPVIPIIPVSRKKQSQDSAADKPAEAAPAEAAPADSEKAELAADAPKAEEPAEAGSAAPTEPSKPAEAPRAAPKSWADLVRSKAAANAAPAPVVSTPPNGVTASKSEAVAEVLRTFQVRTKESENKIPFLKPRGLVNTGNMCYMNSILQILVFCVPFYDFLDQIRKHAAHSFKSDTPMVDAMIMFIREFPIIDSAVSAEQLQMRLKDQELEEYGEPFTPEYVYDVIKRLQRFASMRRGHQQDAEEFLGFLLEQLHEECVASIKGIPAAALVARSPSVSSKSDDNDWMEVGPKQKPAVTRSSGIIEFESPITKIFGGKIRSEFRVPGQRNSVTLEPYQPLQLDIGAPAINNITEALKGLTRPETLHGEFNSPRGPGVNATKQVFIETLPPVLILHLKRFQYDNAGGTQKIWKKVGYPLELEIPKEVFPPHRRQAMLNHGGLPKYRLVGVVYHHGKNASGGHYTVDLRRQNDREWIRLDDTVIRRIRSDEVAEAGKDEDPKILAAAIEKHRRDQSSSSNIFDQVREESEERKQAEKGWNQVNGAAAAVAAGPGAAAGSPAPKKWSGIVNGAVTPTNSSGKATPVGRPSGKDNKVAYILFYQKMGY